MSLTSLTDVILSRVLTRGLIMRIISLGMVSALLFAGCVLIMMILAPNNDMWKPRSRSLGIDDKDVQPLVDFDWKHTNPIPYRPFKNLQHVAMGIKKMPKSELIRIDNGYFKRLAERERIMDAHHPRTFGHGATINPVIGSGPLVNPAIEELFVMIMTFLPRRFPTMFKVQGQTFHNIVTGKSYLVDVSTIDHDTMLRTLGENVEEDFYFMCPDGDGHLRLEGWIACFPGGFSTVQRRGMSMREIHAPVPGYAQRIAKGADGALSRLEPGELIERFNWSLQTDGEDLFRLDGNNFYPENSQTLPDSEDDVNIDECFLRSEHQTLFRLRRTRAVIFCVRSYMTSLHDIKKEGNGPLLATAFESMPEKLGNYKKRPFWQTSIYRFLKSGDEEIENNA
ncbi:hypothetical protein GGR57DRAFT_509395 [Xylariaceae sp. FL1272]|nr:hypothetical protein GGR57DRAFT_509395 [Xylariaceae sp. FL1272]